MLGVAKDAPDSEIRKAYKRMALQLHPDKNKAPGADESFKAIGNAVATLTDDKKRKMYDLYGKDEFNTGGSAGGMRQRQGNEFGFNRGFEADVTAEELFTMFFGGGFPQQQNAFTRTRRFHRTEAQRQPQNREVIIDNIIVLNNRFITYDLSSNSNPVIRLSLTFCQSFC